MAQNQRQMRMGELAVDDMQVCAAHAAALHLQKNLPCARFRQSNILQYEGAANLF
jgi:hypothetical protein